MAKKPTRKDENKQYDKAIRHHSYREAAAELHLDPKRNIPKWAKNAVKRIARALRRRWATQKYVD
jgi:hypothetical protein